MLQPTIEKLRSLKLHGVIQALEEQEESSAYGDLSFEERLGFLIDKEYLLRQNKKLERTLKNAKLKQQCVIEDVDFSATRGLKRSQVMELAQCSWITKAQNLIITGPTGAGKSFLACALADKACRNQLRVRYVKTKQLVQELLVAQADGSYLKLMTAFAKTDLLVIDEWLRDPLSQTHAREILDLLDERFRKKATIFATQLPVANWHQQIDDPTLADAILDRIVHDSHRIELVGGESMRKKTTALQEV